MALEDAAVSWFIRNIIAPKILDIDNPGFVVSKFSDQDGEIYRRELFYPEDMLANIETRFIKKYGKQAEIALYKIGKNFGYTYAKVSHFPTASRTSEAELKKFCHMLVLFVTTTWANKAEELVYDAKKRKFKLRMWDYAVCNKNGIGHLLGDGGIGGIWAYITEDSSVECVQQACQGKGAQFCEFYAAPAKQLTEEGIDCFKVAENHDIVKDEKDHMEINGIRPTRHAVHSMRELIDARFFNYKDRQLMFHETRYFSGEISLYYLLETELARLKGGSDLLFKVCFDFGRRLGAAGQKTNQFTQDYLSAIGFGDVLSTWDGKKRVIIANYFPWTRLSEKSDFAVFRGLASGLLSGSLGEKVVFSKAKTDMVGLDFSIRLEVI